MAPHRSPELRETLTDAAVLNEGAFGNPRGALTSENERANEFIRLIRQYLYQSRRMRMVDTTDSAAAGSSDERE